MMLGKQVKYCVDKIAGFRLVSLSPLIMQLNLVTQNQNSNENIFVRPNDDKTYMIYRTHNLIRSVHYNHASAAG